MQFAPLLLQNSAMFARENRFHTTFGTSVEEMEGAAAAMIGEAFGVATLGIRVLSNNLSNGGAYLLRRRLLLIRLFNLPLCWALSLSLSLSLCVCVCVSIDR